MAAVRGSSTWVENLFGFTSSIYPDEMCKYLYKSKSLSRQRLDSICTFPIKTELGPACGGARRWQTAQTGMKTG